MNIIVFLSAAFLAFCVGYLIISSEKVGREKQRTELIQCVKTVSKFAADVEGKLSDEIYNKSIRTCYHMVLEIN
jgi:hypothetical protein